MASQTSMLKDLGNTLYKGTLAAVGTTGSRYLTTNVFKMKDRDIKFDIKSIVMLGLDIGVGLSVVDQLQSTGLIPKTIF